MAETSYYLHIISTVLIIVIIITKETMESVQFVYEMFVCLSAGWKIFYVALECGFHFGGNL